MEKGEEKGGKEKSGSVLLKSLFCGGMAGMASKSFVAPLDRVKILLQTQNSAYKNKGVVSALGIQYSINPNESCKIFFIFRFRQINMMILHNSDN